MITKENVSLQEISWVKSNKKALTSPTAGKIDFLLYPETYEELLKISRELLQTDGEVNIIGYSSNTLFLPSYHAQHMICTKKLNTWEDTGEELICNVGLKVTELVKYCINKGYQGFEGLIDLPGTVASAVYGNCGCFGYLINDNLKYIEILTYSGDLLTLTKEDLKLSFRSSILKRKERKGVITKVVFDIHKIQSSNSLFEIAQKAHNERQRTQPSAANNLGTSLLIYTQSTKTRKGYLFNKIWLSLNKRFPSRDKVTALKITFILFGKWFFLPYIWNLYRFMFYDERSHKIFSQYIEFVQSIYPDSHLEIEIRK